MSAPPAQRSTARLVAPAGAGGDDVLSRARDRLVRGIVAVADGSGPPVRVDVSLASLRRAGLVPPPIAQPEPAFAWRPAFVRRSLGLAAIRSCAEGFFSSPGSAVGPLAEGAVESWQLTGERRFHWEPWLAGLGVGGRAVVLADAVTWATPLWTAFDWSALGARATIGGPDNRWSCPGPHLIRLSGRQEARIVPADDGRSAHRAKSAGRGRTGRNVSDGPTLVSMGTGRPGGGWQKELGYLALVAGLHSSGGSLPSHVVGLWPESGVRHTLAVDGALLDGAVDRVVATVAGMVRTESGATSPTARGVSTACEWPHQASAA